MTQSPSIQRNALQRYRVDYRFNDSPCTMVLGEFGEPSLEQVKLHLLLRHGGLPQVIGEAPWESPAARSSLDTRLMEAGIEAIHVVHTNP